jgi:hypothetical protein
MILALSLSSNNTPFALFCQVFNGDGESLSFFRIFLKKLLKSERKYDIIPTILSREAEGPTLRSPATLHFSP